MKNFVPVHSDSFFNMDLPLVQVLTDNYYCSLSCFSSPKLPPVAGVVQRRNFPLEEHQLVEVGASQGGPLRLHPLHGSRAWRRVVLDEQVQFRILEIFGEKSKGEGFPLGLTVQDACPQQGKSGELPTDNLSR